jgi:hypothetical protein
MDWICASHGNSNPGGPMNQTAYKPVLGYGVREAGDYPDFLFRYGRAVALSILATVAI